MGVWGRQKEDAYDWILGWQERVVCGEENFNAEAEAAQCVAKPTQGRDGGLAPGFMFNIFNRSKLVSVY